MSDVSTIRDALKTRISTISGLHVYDTVPGDVLSPAAVVWRRNGPRTATQGVHSYDYTFVVTVLVSQSADGFGQDKVDALISPTGSSIPAALDADPELGDTVEFAFVSDVEQDQKVEYGGKPYAAVDVVVTVGSL
jgi:hypothetical protein